MNIILHEAFPMCPVKSTWRRMEYVSVYITACHLDKVVDVCTMYATDELLSNKLFNTHWVWL